MEPDETVSAVAFCEFVTGGVLPVLTGGRSRLQAGLMATDRNLYVFLDQPPKAGGPELLLKQPIASSDLRYEKPYILVGEYTLMPISAEKKSQDVVEALRQPAAPA